MDFRNLKPAGIWNYFYDITQIPRPSKKEEKILAYLLEFAKKTTLKPSKTKQATYSLPNRLLPEKKIFKP